LKYPLRNRSQSNNKDVTVVFNIMSPFLAEPSCESTFKTFESENNDICFVTQNVKNIAFLYQKP